MPYIEKEHGAGGGTTKIEYNALEVDPVGQLFCLVVHDLYAVLNSFKKSLVFLKRLIKDMLWHNDNLVEFAKEIRAGKHPGFDAQDAQRLERESVGILDKVKHLERVKATLERLIKALSELKPGEKIKWCWRKDSLLGGHMSEILERACPVNEDGEMGGFPGQWGGLEPVLIITPPTSPRGWVQPYP